MTLSLNNIVYNLIGSALAEEELKELKSYLWALSLLITFIINIYASGVILLFIFFMLGKKYGKSSQILFVKHLLILFGSLLIMVIMVILPNLFWIAFA